MSQDKLSSINLNQAIMDGEPRYRQLLASQYMMNLDNGNLLQNYYWQAGINHKSILRETGKNPDDCGDGMH